MRFINLNLYYAFYYEKDKSIARCSREIPQVNCTIDEQSLFLYSQWFNAKTTGGNENSHLSTFVAIHKFQVIYLPKVYFDGIWVFSCRGFVFVDHRDTNVSDWIIADLGVHYILMLFSTTTKKITMH